MRTINKRATEVMDRITGGLNIENVAMNIDNTDGTFIHVEWINKVPDGELYTVAHYYKQNGDLMCEVSVTFLKATLNGHYYPIGYRLDDMCIARDVVIFDKGGNITGCYTKEQREVVIFAGEWMADIKAQQGVKWAVGNYE